MPHRPHHPHHPHHHPGPGHGPHDEWLVGFDNELHPAEFARVLRHVADGLEEGLLRLAHEAVELNAHVRGTAHLARTPKHHILRLEVHALRGEESGRYTASVDEMLGLAAEA